MFKTHMVPGNAQWITEVWGASAGLTILFIDSTLFSGCPTLILGNDYDQKCFV